MRRSEALRLRGVIEMASQFLDDTTALDAVALHPQWAAGRAYSVGVKVSRGDDLYRCLTAHTAQEDWAPEAAASLWEQICENHRGTSADPIPYSGNMALESGKYYSGEGAVYLCIRDTVNPVYCPLADLTGIYVEKI